MKRLFFWLGGLMSGVVNGLLGAGGGMITVPLLKTQMDDKEAHATSVAVILPVCAVSASMYLLRGNVSISDAIPYIPFGIVGALTGIWIFSRIKPSMLRKIFAVFMIWAGYRMVTR